MYHHFTKPEGSDIVIPITREVAIQLADPPEGVDRSLWLYELCRFLTMKVNNLIIAFFAEDPPCSVQTCPEMRASEWQYLCAVHDPPKSCCAIDYCCHTLDWANNTLTSPKYFPSRLTLGSEAGGGPQASMRHLTNVFRRLYRIFAHAWFQHRDVFWEVEGHDGLYIFFRTVCDIFQLIPEDNYTIPPEAEGLDAIQPKMEEQPDSKRLTILRKEIETPHPAEVEGLDPSISTGATTRRHKHSPSTGSRVTTITESAEDPEEISPIQAPLREVLKESPEPRPPSAVENRPKLQPEAENTDSAATEETPTSAVPTSDSEEESPEAIGEPGEEPEESLPEPEEKTDEPAQDEEVKPEDSTSTEPLEGENVATSSVDQEPKESESEPESQPETPASTSEPESESKTEEA